MTNKIEIFNNPSFGSVRVFNDNDGKVWFSGSDVATALGYVNSRQALNDHVTDKHKTRIETIRVNGTPITLIDEAGLYRLVMRSQLPTAEDFQEWVTSEVLPSIRKTGSYSIVKSPIERILANSVDQLEAVEAIKEVLLVEKQKQQAITLERDVYSDMVDDIMQDNTTYTATEIAKDLGISSAKALNKWLVDVGFMYKSGKSYLPYSKYSQEGYTSHKLYDTGHGFNVKTVKFTNKGKLWIVEKWKEDHKALFLTSNSGVTNG